MRKSRCAALLLALILSPARAEWLLDGDSSSISYVTTKANVAAEVNHFRRLSGTISGDGAAQVTIDLDSVDTAVAIRDERMRDILFETAQFPAATVSVRIEPQQLDSAPGSVSVVVAEAVLDLRGMEVTVTFEAMLARLDEDNLLVTATRPVVVNASQFGLLDGIEKLRTIAGLPSISPAVPVSFVLKWTRQ